MSRVEELRAEAKRIYEQADNTEDREQRFEIILKAMILETEADSLERESVAPSSSQPEARRQVAHQQQQPQPDDDTKE